jgi:uncharacterized protein
MKIIGLEEHLVTDEILGAWSQLGPEQQADKLKIAGTGDLEARLRDLGEERIKNMDDCGVDVQVLSLTTPGVQNLEPAESVAVARQVNDFIAAAVRGRPDRFEGFATLPTPAPARAALELRRCVTNLGCKGAMLCGRTRDRNVDHPDFRPIFEEAAKLRVPLYLHPQVPQRAVRDVYYSGFGEPLDQAFAAFGIGWHYETGIQLLRLILADTFDRHPDLQIIVGHWGEVILYYLDRIDALSKMARGLRRPISEYVKSNVYVTPSGMFSHVHLRRSMEILGVDRIMFATDYPFQLAPGGGARTFLEGAGLSREDQEKIAHGNWERLFSRA